MFVCTSLARTRLVTLTVLCAAGSGLTPTSADGQPTVRPSTRGIVLRSLRIEGEATVFEYVVTNPASGANGFAAKVVVDVSAPASAGAEWLGEKPKTFLGDIAASRPENAVGHAPLSVACPAQRLWISGVDGDGQVWCELYAAGNGRRAGLAPGQSATFSLRSVSIPFLRAARMVPWQDPRSVDPDGGVPTKRLIPEVSSIVAGPGIAAAQLTDDIVKGQVRVACGAHMLSATACTGLPAAIAAHDRTAALALLGSGRDGNVPHALVVMTVAAQLQALLAP